MRSLSIVAAMLAVGCARPVPVRTGAPPTAVTDAAPPAAEPAVASACWRGPSAEPTFGSTPGWIDFGPIECTPEPPEPASTQARWAPTQALPSSVVTAASEALESGPDPRELRFHEVEIWEGTVWDHGGRVRAFGFVRPSLVPGERPFVWLFGEWHAVVALGPEVDLAEHCRLSLEGTQPEAPCSSDRHGFWQMAASVWDQTFCPQLLAVIALEQREPQLALQIATALAEETAELERRLASAEVVVADADESAEWMLAFGLLRRALLAHMRGDDCLALRVLRQDESVYAQGDESPRRRGGGGLAALRAFRADQERRALGRRSTVPDVPPDGPVPAELVPALITSLDEIAEVQLSQPGGACPSCSPQVEALVRAGPSAVPLLIDTIEHDERLTRTVSFFRDFAPSRRIHTVRDVALSALEQLVGASFPIDVEVYSLGSPQSWSRFAAHLRAWWARPVERPSDRSLAMLRDDALGPAAWADAATWLRGTYYAWREPEIDIGRHRTRPPPYDVPPEEQVGELLMRRADESLRADAPSEACSLARTAWNADASVGPRLARFARQCARGTCPCLDYLVSSLGSVIPELYESLDAYQPTAAGHPLQLLSRAPEHPAVARLGEHVFARPPFAPSRSPAPPPPALVQHYLRGGRVAPVPALRAIVLRALRDRRVVGRVIADESARVETTRDGTRWSWGQLMLEDGRTHRVRWRSRGAEVRARVCDLWADVLDPANTFWVDDDEAVRDQFIDELADSLADTGDEGAPRPPGARAVSP